MAAVVKMDFYMVFTQPCKPGSLYLCGYDTGLPGWYLPSDTVDLQSLNVENFVVKF